MVKYNFMKPRELKNSKLYKPLFVKNEGVILNFSFSDNITYRINKARLMFLQNPMVYLCIFASSAMLIFGVGLTLYREMNQFQYKNALNPPVYNYFELKDNENYKWNNLYQKHEKTKSEN